MSPNSRFLSFLRHTDCHILSTHFIADTDSDPRFKVHPDFGVYKAINRRISHCTKITAQRFLRKKRVLLVSS